MKRRDFFNVLGISAAGLAAGSMIWKNGIAEAWEHSADFCFKEPFDGGIIHKRHGDPVLGVVRGSDGKERLKIRVSGIAPLNAEVRITGPDKKTIIPQRKGTEFFTELLLADQFSEISGTCKIGEKERTIRTRPVWAKNSFKRYKFQIDDNSFFLRDIYQKQYKDLFECFYLAGLRDLHKKYGSRFTLNCFWQTPEKDFDLSRFSERYKSQWEDNSDWLRLAFHAKQEFPDSPYENAAPAELASDFDLVAGDLKRIAGKAYTPPAIIHWGTIRPEAYKVLWDRGSRCLSGYFVPSKLRKWSVSFQLPEEVCQYMLDHEGWMHFETGLTFSRLELVCNMIPLEMTVPILQNSVKIPGTAEVLDFLTHEQYFWPYYKRYLPDHFQRLDAALRFATENGYKPVWHHEGFFSIPSEEKFRPVS
ncbi:MAG: hypothetical protein Q4G69_09980 [Planctomycetia bacterium]|nr:hypothetical protein [Planctomycetia bacterium]